MKYFLAFLIAFPISPFCFFARDTHCLYSKEIPGTKTRDSEEMHYRANRKELTAFDYQKQRYELSLMALRKNWEAEKKIEMALFKRKTIFISISFIILFSLLTFLINSFGMRKANSKNPLQGKLMVESEATLDDAEKAEENYSAYVNNINLQNQRIEELQSQLDLISSSYSVQKRADNRETLMKLLNATIITDEGWQQFKGLYAELDAGFFIRLKEKYPFLSQGETRLLSLLKLDLSNKEIAAMLGVSPESVKKSRYRLRKKICTRPDITLEEIATTI